MNNSFKGILMNSAYFLIQMTQTQQLLYQHIGNIGMNGLRVSEKGLAARIAAGRYIAAGEKIIYK